MNRQEKHGYPPPHLGLRPSLTTPEMALLNKRKRKYETQITIIILKRKNIWFILCLSLSNSSPVPLLFWTVLLFLFFFIFFMCLFSCALLLSYESQSYWFLRRSDCDESYWFLIQVCCTYLFQGCFFFIYSCINFGLLFVNRAWICDFFSKFLVQRSPSIILNYNIFQ